MGISKVLYFFVLRQKYVENRKRFEPCFILFRSEAFTSKSPRGIIDHKIIRILSANVAYLPPMLNFSYIGAPSNAVVTQYCSDKVL